MDYYLHYTKLGVLKLFDTKDPLSETVFLVRKYERDYLYA